MQRGIVKLVHIRAILTDTDRVSLNMSGFEFLVERRSPLPGGPGAAVQNGGAAPHLALPFYSLIVVALAFVLILPYDRETCRREPFAIPGRSQRYRLAARGVVRPRAHL